MPRSMTLFTGAATTTSATPPTFHITHPLELGDDAYLPEFMAIVTPGADTPPFLAGSPSIEMGTIYG